MRILGIETSCDDTGVAVLEVAEGLPTGKAGKNLQFKILSNVVASQIDVHQEYGGVYPMLAKREHEKNLPIVLKKALAEASIQDSRSRTIDTIAVTYGPGLSPCLWAGLNFAKDLAKKWSVPLVPVDHIEGHLLMALFHNRSSFPAIALIVSGGHTQLVLVKDVGKYEMIGETRDDAAGECFDKTARVLGLSYPGGPEIAREASAFAKATADKAKFKISLPRPMIHTKDYDFSFSGLKTAVLYDYKDRPQQVRESKEYIQEMAAEIQQAIIDVLLHKTMNAAKEFGAKSIILGGGVSANESLRNHLKESTGVENIKLLAPPKNLSTDNGLMIALAGYFQFQKGNAIKNWDELENLEARPNLRLA